jgi:hypothetical protein
MYVCKDGRKKRSLFSNSAQHNETELCIHSALFSLSLVLIFLYLSLFMKCFNFFHFISFVFERARIYARTLASALYSSFLYMYKFILEALGNKLRCLFGKLEGVMINKLAKLYNRKQMPGEDVRSYMTAF